MILIGLTGGIIGVLLMADNARDGNPLNSLAGFTVGVTLGVGYTSCFLSTPRQRVASLIGSLVGLGWGILSVIADTYLFPARNIAVPPGILLHNLIYELIYKLVIIGLIFVFIARGVARFRSSHT